MEKFLQIAIGGLVLQVASLQAQVEQLNGELQTERGAHAATRAERDHQLATATSANRSKP